jgi:hypothetical protein
MIMEYDTNLAAQYAGTKLDSLINRTHRDTMNLVEKGDIPTIVKHFDAVRTEYRSLKDKIEKLEAEVNQLSYEIIPTMFTNQDVKTIKIDDVGRVTVNQRWVASMPDKEAGMNWLRVSGNDGLIIETVNAQTLAAFAKTQAIAGSPLPDAVFTVGVAPYTSITKS